MTAVLHVLAALLYGASAALDAWRPARERSGTLLLAGGALAQATAFLSLHTEEPPLSLESFPAGLSLIGWLVAVCYLSALGVARVRDVGRFVAVAAAAFAAVAALGLWAGPRPELRAGSGGAWSHAHVLLSTLGFALLALSSLAGLAYLVKERRLKRKRGSQGLPSLESLDRIGHLTLALGFPLLTLGMACGFAWSASHALAPWSSHSLFLTAAWCVYLLPLHLRLLRRQHGDRPARLVVAGFVLLAFSYIGVRLIGSSA
jgi:ABC-type transport system involved in cytochrome c biogenesis permease subunit